ncbi:SCO family protein [Variovorax sp. GB1R11]|uniref:SCO family protein n=1 Tax=Variovorax sp. GB1R11 TaxID=3443741 RepID=UPI003F474F44
MPEILASAAPSCCCAAAAAPKPVAPPAPVSGRFELVDHFGQAVDEHSFGTRHLLVFFGFSHCALVCPRELAKLGAALEMLGPLAERVQPLYISVDPARDTPAVLQRYLSQYTHHAGGFLGLTGSPEQVEAAKKSFRVFAEPVPDANAPGGYVVPHTALAYLMAPGGRYATHFAETLDAATVSARIRTHLERTTDAAA